MSRWYTWRPNNKPTKLICREQIQKQITMEVMSIQLLLSLRVQEHFNFTIIWEFECATTLQSP